MEKRIQNKKKTCSTPFGPRLEPSKATSPTDRPNPQHPSLSSFPFLIFLFFLTGGPHPSYSSPTSNRSLLHWKRNRSVTIPHSLPIRNGPRRRPLISPTSPLCFPLLSPSILCAKLHEFLAGVRRNRRRSPLVPTRWSNPASPLGLPLLLLSLAHLLMLCLAKIHSEIEC
jgi:hypothetical protein